MLKRRQKTPEEQRVERIRRAWLATFAAMILLLLLIVVWFGAVFARESPPSRLRLSTPADGYMVVRVDYLLTRLRKGTDLGTEPMRRYLDRQADILDTSLGECVEVYFLRQQEGTGWLASAPIARPQRVFVEKLRRGITDSGLLRPEGSDREGDAVGWFRLDRRGVYLSSTALFPNFNLVEEGAFLEEDLAARYSGVEGFLPLGLARRLPSDTQASVVEVRWPRTGAPAEVEFRLVGGAVVRVPWFDPVLSGDSDL